MPTMTNSQGEVIEYEIPAPDPNAVSIPTVFGTSPNPKPHQCPVCFGRGLVPNGFYTAVGSSSWLTSCCESEQCRSCEGKGYVVI